MNNTAKRLAFAAGIEAVILLASRLLGHGRAEGMLTWITGMHLTILLIILLGLWVARHRQTYMNGARLTTPGKVKVLVGAFLILVLVGEWALAVAPLLVRTSLQHFGRPDTATIVAYHFVRYGYRGSEFTSYDLSHADAIALELSYHYRTETIVIEKTAPGFNQAYREAQDSRMLPVRYLPLLPGLVRPETELVSGK